MNVAVLRPAPAIHAAAPPMAEGEVHVWRIAIEGPPSPRVLAQLDDAELARAATFRFERHRQRYVQGRAAMRRLLAIYLGVAPREVPLEPGLYGKPRLRGGGPLQFNLAHSAGEALLAVGRRGAVGVDVEHVSPRPGLRTLAASVMTAAELDALDRAGAAAQDHFHAVWTRKEACLKALGTGLVLDPRRVHVGAARNRAIVHVPGSREAIEVCSLDLGPGLAAAIAVAGGFAHATLLHAASA